MNKEQFYRKDYNTFKPKYFLFCREKEFEIKKYDKSLAQNKNNSYIRRIKIETL